LFDGGVYPPPDVVAVPPEPDEPMLLKIAAPEEHSSNHNRLPEVRRLGEELAPATLRCEVSDRTKATFTRAMPAEKEEIVHKLNMPPPGSQSLCHFPRTSIRLSSAMSDEFGFLI
jgi:hypothetical protein